MSEENKQNLAEAYEKARSTSIIYTHIAHALARGYTDLYYVNMETDEYIEFHTDDESGVLNEARRGGHFFEGVRKEAEMGVHHEDLEAFLDGIDRKKLTKELDKNRVIELTYRRIKDGESFYVLMKISRMEDDKRFIVMAVSNIDELVKKRQAEERVREERTVYARLHAITGNFICVYVVDPKTDRYREFSATDVYKQNLSQAKVGTDFFEKVREAGRIYNYPADVDFFLSVFTKENVMAEIERTGIFTLAYRFVMEGSPIHVQLKAAMVEEEGHPRLIVGLNNVDVQVRQDVEFRKRLAQAESEANIDPLTGVKNKHAYLKTEVFMDRQIADRRQSPFAIVMLDVNDLKKVNDTAGHQAGDLYLTNACRVICDIFKQSPVYRVGGDEFAVIAQGNDYARINTLLGELWDHNTEALKSGGVVIACGMARFENDSCVAAVFERADHDMYENKNTLKHCGRK